MRRNVTGIIALDGVQRRSEIQGALVRARAKGGRHLCGDGFDGVGAFELSGDFRDDDAALGGAVIRSGFGGSPERRRDGERQREDEAGGSGKLA